MCVVNIHMTCACVCMCVFETERATRTRALDGVSKTVRDWEKLREAERNKETVRLRGAERDRERDSERQGEKEGESKYKRERPSDRADTFKRARITLNRALYTLKKSAIYTQIERHIHSK